MRWLARHQDFCLNESFTDVMERGPFARWSHCHRFTPSGDIDHCALVIEQLSIRIADSSGVFVDPDDRAVLSVRFRFELHHFAFLRHQTDELRSTNRIHVNLLGNTHDALH